MRAYIKKVLDGLIYLHDQGVIHRYIKPDNILITKDGNVKLADFGVSTKLNNLKSSEEENTVPAGTPYYMAPEVIEFYGARPESDVWSLGCTVIELLQGEPPYYSFDPFSAMYKMVEDEHPPLPLGITEELRDFMMCCFRKDVNMRTPAKLLVNHNWLKNLQSRLQSDLTQAIGQISNYNVEFEKELKKIPIVNDRDRKEESKQQAIKPGPKSPERKPKETANRVSPSLSVSDQQSKRSVVVESQEKNPGKNLPPTNEDTEDWDLEFGFSNEPKGTIEKDLLWTETEEAEPKGHGALTLGLPSLEGIHFSLAGKVELPVAGEGGQTEMEEDIFANFDEITEYATPIEEPLAGLKSKISHINLATEKTETNARPKPLLAWAEKPDENDSFELSFVKPTKANKGKSKKSKITENTTSHISLENFAEEDNENNDDFGSIELSKLDVTKLSSKLQSKKVQQWETEDMNIFEGEKAPEDEKNLFKEKVQEAKLQEIKQLILDLRPNKQERDIKNACLQLIGIFSQNPDLRVYLINNHGILPLLLLLESENDAVISSVLELISKIIDDTKILLNLCVMGLIPAMTLCGEPSRPLSMRIYVARFIQQVISTPETLQIFIACRGLVLLCDFLEPDFKRNSVLLHIALSSISAIFNVHSSKISLPKNEFFHLFVNIGLTEKLNALLVPLVEAHKRELQMGEISKRKEELSDLQMVLELFRVFSKGDSDVKQRIGRPEILKNIVFCLRSLDFRSIELSTLLNTMLNITYDRFSLERLIVIIEPLLAIGMYFVKRNEFVREIFNPITQSLFHLCRLKHKQRQEAAANAGLVPFLMFVASKNKALKDFAIPLLCELSKTSSVTRAVLWQNQGLEFYLDLLRDNSTSFHTDVLDAIASCLENGTERSEKVLITNNNILLLKSVFIDSKEHQFITLLESLLKILSVSKVINRQLGSDTSPESLVSILKNKLSCQDPVARLHLLKILLILCSKQEKPGDFLKKNNLLKAVKFMSESDNSDLVKNVAVQLLKEGQASHSN